MASPLGRGAQVRLDGDAQALARGAVAADGVLNSAAKNALERAGLVADGYTADGSTTTGTAAEDEVLTPGGVVVGGTSSGPAPYLGQVATGCFMPRSIDSRANVWAKTRDLVITTEAVTNPRVGWARWRVASGTESAPSGDGTILAAIEYPTGVLTYSRQNIAAGSAGSPAPVPQPTNATTFLDFDIALPARARVYLRVLQQAATGGVLFRQGQHALSARPGCWFNNGTGTPPALDAAYAGSASEFSYPPWRFLGWTVRPSILMGADSREEGGLEGSRPPFYDNGMILGAVGRHFGYASMAESASTLTAFVNGTAANRARRTEYPEHFSHVVNAWNVNDFNAGRTVAQVLADRATFATLFPNNIVVGVTCQPYTISSDGWATIANQGLGTQQPKIRQLNRAIRAGIAGEAFIFDVAKATDPNDRDRWPVSPDPSAVAFGSACTFTGSIPANSTTLTVTAVASGALAYGMTITDSLDGAAYTDQPFAGTMILEQLTGTTGGVGTYTVSIANPNNATTSKTMYAGAAWATKDGLHGNGLIAEFVRRELAGDIAQIRR